MSKREIEDKNLRTEKSYYTGHEKHKKRISCASMSKVGSAVQTLQILEEKMASG